MFEEVAGGAAARVGPQQPQHHRRRLCGPAPTLLAGHRSEPKTPTKERSSIKKKKTLLSCDFYPTVTDLRVPTVYLTSSFLYFCPFICTSDSFLTEKIMF